MTRSRCSSLSCVVSTKEQTLAICSPVAHDKRATGEICSFSQGNHSFTHKKLAICSKTNEQIPNPEEFAYSNLCSANFAHFQPSWHQPFDLSIALLLYRLGLNLERVINYAGKVASVQGYDGYRFITFVWNSPYFVFRSHSS